MDGMCFIRSGEEPYMQLDRLQLRNYFPHEIEKLSVIRVTQTKTFDEIGHPVKGGLYDPALGPRGNDRCETCHQYDVHCPGHIGHIKLDVPVFNPVLYSFTLNLFKGSCVQCHRLTCNADGLTAKVFLAQLRCFELGVPHLIPVVASAYKDKLSNMDVSDNMTIEEEMQLLAEVDKMITDYVEKPLSELKCGVPDKNTIDLKKEIMTEFLRGSLFRRREKCPLCGGKNGKLTNDQARCIILNFASAAKSKIKTTKKPNMYRDEFEVEESEEESDKEVDLEKIGYGGIDVSEGSLDQQMMAVRRGACDKLAWRAAEVREHFRLLFKNDGRFLMKVFPFLCEENSSNICPLDGLFSELIVVPPTKFRPIRFFKGSNYEDPQTVNLRNLLEAAETIKAIVLVMKGDKSSALLELIAHKVHGKTINAKMHNAYVFLQRKMNAIFDEDLEKGMDSTTIPGIKQVLEKKQGLFRMNMMGKRVNFACRSVITPDPYLDIDEIGIPEVFAKKLTFSEPVNVYNLQYLRKLVKNGSENHPGANFVYNSSQKKIILQDDYKELRNVSKSLQPANADHIKGPMRVLRHLRNGDMMMMNRQPSLHKPSIMGHRCRVLKGQRALRMNYAPCKAYNADFDGDEMNGHLVQSYIAQSEVADIADVGSNLLVPKDATPLLGLIQDHVVSGVLLTLRGRFLNKEDFMHLVLASFAHHTDRIEIPPPCMILPQQLWSGKQVISCILKNCIPAGKPLINLNGKAKTPLSCWKVRGFPEPQFDMSESQVIFREGELLVGVLDKAHYGATQFGLAHCCFELYGPKIGVKVLSCFSRLFTTYLQFHGFTLGVADILIRPEADEDRTKQVLESRTIGDQVTIKTFNLKENASQDEIKHALASAYNNPAGQGTDVKMLDYGMKQGVAKYNDAIIKSCVPSGLIRSFPENALQLMIQSGAKGSSVNAIQLEGKRMAVTIAGRTLPSFKSFDSSPRAGGYIDQRFLTGINPQELFFHTMAGREGLIDTAVKTSRSGYLQRCIIKHLEGIKVHYDSTVRDHDGSIIQFRYGEDGLDTCKSSFLSTKTFKFLEDNLDAAMSCKPGNVRDREYGVVEAEKQYYKIQKWRRKREKKGITGKTYQSGFTEFSYEHLGMDKSSIIALWLELSPEEKKEYEKRAPSRCPTAVDEKFNLMRTLGALPEKTLDIINDYVGDNDNMKHVLFWKGMQSIASPGENVGLLAAQSIGEPSTQMTLNTFHFAGRGEMNVTLGIPRLREILMTASKNIATPSAQIAVIPGTSREKIDRIKQDLDRVYLKDVLRNFTLEDRINLSNGERWRRYILRLEILPAQKREKGAQHLKRRRIMREMEKRFFKLIAKTIENKLKTIANYQQVQTKKMRQGNLIAGIGNDVPDARQRRRIDDGASSDEEADGGNDADAGEKRLHNRHNDEAADYEGEEEDRGAVEEEVPEIPEDEENDDEYDQESEGEDTPESGPVDETSNPDLRIRQVLQSAGYVVEYEFDVQKDRWCQVVFQTPLSSKTKLDMSAIIDKEIENFIVHQTPGIERCVESVQNKNGVDVTYIQTQGVNLQALFRYSNWLDVNSVYSNDLNLVLNQYGVEACAKAIVTEMNNVFGVYGIEVSKRHLSLTADYMTFTGRIAPFNRGAMSSSASPLQKMTFETTVAFLRESLLHGEEDYLSSPSARLVVGSLSQGGTGSFDILFDMDYSS